MSKKWIRRITPYALYALWLLGGFAGPLVVSASGATTTVAQTVRNSDGSLASGTVMIHITAACRSGSDYIGDKTISVKFTGGNFTVTLVPNDTCVPSGTSYTVAWLFSASSTRTETWLVPAIGSPVTVDTVVVNPSPGNSWAQMTAATWSQLVP